MAAARLACYLEGGCPPGGSRANPGARDATPPGASEPVDLPGTTYFAGESPQWGGGVAFYDHDEPGWTAARAYLVTAGQLADIAAQEMYRIPVDGDPLEEVAARSARRRPAHLGARAATRRWSRWASCDGAPLLTFTSPHGAAARSEHSRRRRRTSRRWRPGSGSRATGTKTEISAYLDSLVPRLGCVP